MLYQPKEVNYGGDWKEMCATVDENMKRLTDIDKKQKQKGTILFRYINHPHADSYAYYQVIRENQKSVRIKVVTGIGDDWVLPAWGCETTIPKNVARGFIQRRDSWDSLVSKSKG